MSTNDMSHPAENVAPVGGLRARYLRVLDWAVGTAQLGHREALSLLHDFDEREAGKPLLSILLEDQRRTWDERHGAFPPAEGDALLALLIAHQRVEFRDCTCGAECPTDATRGWHPAHLADVLRRVIPLAAKCRDCGAEWHPVRRGECSRCGSDNTPIPPAKGGAR